MGTKTAKYGNSWSGPVYAGPTASGAWALGKTAGRTCELPSALYLTRRLKMRESLALTSAVEQFARFDGTPTATLAWTGRRNPSGLTCLVLDGDCLRPGGS